MQARYFVRRVIAASLAMALVSGGLAVADLGASAGATPPASAAALSTPGGYGALTPARILDTRQGVGAPARPVAARQSLTVQVDGRGGVPNSGVAAVLLNVTVTQPASAGYITVYADGTPRPHASNVNYSSGETVPNSVIAPVGTDGKVMFYADSTTHLLADVSGFYLSGQPRLAGAFGVVSPARLLDTRQGVGAPASPVPAGGVVDVPVVGRSGVPTSGIAAVVLNVTVTQPAAAGYVTSYASETARPSVSNVNFLRGETVPNLVVAPVGADGKVALFASVSTHLIADVFGYYLAGQAAAGGAYGGVTPDRLLDTRSGVGAVAGQVQAGHTLTLTVSGTGGLPASGVSAVLLNVTVTQPSAAGYVAVFAGGATRPAVSNLNYTRGETVPNLVVAPVSSDGKIALYTTATTHLVADVFGYQLTPSLTITSTTLRSGQAGAPFTDVLSAVGGTGQFTWTATDLPGGLTLAPDGTVSGTPTTTGTFTVTATVTDSAGAQRTAQVAIPVPTALPEDCLTQSCTHATPDIHTRQVPASAVRSVARSGGVITSITTAGLPPPAVGDIQVFAPTVDMPSGYIGTATSSSTNADGTVKIVLSRAMISSAYTDGTVKAIGDPVVSNMTRDVPGPVVVHPSVKDRVAKQRASASRHPGATSRPAPAHSRPAAELSCSGGVESTLQGLDVQPALQPSVVAQWGFFSGLTRFQFDLDGSITADMGVTVSGSGTCTLSLPALHTAVPAGVLGAIVFDLEPELTFAVSGKIDIRTSVTLSCNQEFVWDHGNASRSSHCGVSYSPLQLSADSGLDATLTGTIDTSASLDDVAGVTGSLSAALHAGYHPTQHPVAELDASVDYELGACLACFWGNGPHVTVASGELYHAIIATYGSVTPVQNDPIITTTHLPDAQVGVPYSTELTTADHRVGTWSVSSGGLPDGLSLSGFTVSGKPTTPGVRSFGLTFVDSAGRSATATASVEVLPAGGSSTGAIEPLAYCSNQIFDRNDDDSTGPISLPFTADLFGNSFDSLYVSNNGYVTFGGSQSNYTPYPLIETELPIIAPFFADVDTRGAGSSLVTFGASSDNTSFCVNWVNVGYYSEHDDLLNSFQLILTARPDVGPGDFDITFNYGSISWETGDASGGSGGFGGSAARAGYSGGSGTDADTYELPGSGENGALVDGGPDALVSGSLGSFGQTGRYVYPVRN